MLHLCRDDEYQKDQNRFLFVKMKDLISVDKALLWIIFLHENNTRIWSYEFSF